MGVPRLSSVRFYSASKRNVIIYTPHREGPNGARLFPNEIVQQTNLTVEFCLNQCAAFGYPAAGLEFGQECCKSITLPWDALSNNVASDCGDVSDIAQSPGFAPASDCNIACPGDPIHLCGGGDRLQVRIKH